jgi:hypothetical protein
MQCHVFGILETHCIPWLHIVTIHRPCEEDGKLHLHDRILHVVCFEGSASEAAEDSAGSFFAGDLTVCICTARDVTVLLVA